MKSPKLPGSAHLQEVEAGVFPGAPNSFHPCQVRPLLFLPLLLPHPSPTLCVGGARYSLVTGGGITEELGWQIKDKFYSLPYPLSL